ncbi:MAG TPA: ImmA/IrrE family metallo-endopeptidase, partial [Gemmatimonadaceae bacterium]|nr:ImmA/IrrE family metallo-endopeptidase [Gemmatimonadaceae bacterium]
DALICDLGVEVRYRRDRLAFNGSTDLEREVPLIELAWVRRTDSPSLLPWGDGDKLSGGLPHQYDARTRFTLAHEFGHVLLDRLDKRRPLPPAMTPQNIEHLCDAIGAELLMPTCWFRDKVGSEAMFDDLRRVSIRAGTSISSTIVRARHLGYGIGALYLTPAPTGGWHVQRAYGLHAKDGLRLNDKSASRLSGMPMKSVVEANLDLACGRHLHRARVEIRRTFSSAVMVVHSIDGIPIRFSSNWHCNHR